MKNGAQKGLRLAQHSQELSEVECQPYRVSSWLQDRLFNIDGPKVVNASVQREEEALTAYQGPVRQPRPLGALVRLAPHVLAAVLVGLTCGGCQYFDPPHSPLGPPAAAQDDWNRRRDLGNRDAGSY